MAFNIYDFVFYDILKYDYSSSVLTGELQHDIIFGLLVPTIFIAIVLYFFVRNIFGAGSTIIGNLSAITALGVVITLGWVPLIAGLGGFAFVIILALAFIRAIYGRLVPKGIDTKLYGGAKFVGRRLDMGNPTLSKIEYRKLEKELKIANDEYNDACEFLKNLYAGKVKTQGHYVVGEKCDAQENRHRDIKRFSFDTAQEILDQIPRGQRKTFIENNTDDKHDFKKQLFRLYDIN